MIEHQRLTCLSAREHILLHLSRENTGRESLVFQYRRADTLRDDEVDPGTKPWFCSTEDNPGADYQSS